MIAKPIIDIAVRVAGTDEFDVHRPSLDKAGWRVGSGVRTHPVVILERQGVRVSIAHFFDVRVSIARFFDVREWDAVHQRGLRDSLRTRPADAARYERVKIAADASAQDGRAYNAGKTDIIQQIVDRARAERGLESVRVWDK
ncbi:GrpB family protein [Microbacterium sp.]|uniref:GrpB family protein n=1 Tax=Microbacterium sp. TaxID=51671 RepID=UPI0028120869|nr:GrpB family protein [Microbacterium sp.]